ncbi:MAG: hydrogenase formation protein HypD, partial [Bacteroidota bacterium]
QKVIHEVFEVKNQMWRGIGEIPQSGYGVKPKYAEYDATRKFSVNIEEAPEHPDCISGQIMKGIKKPFECAQFGKTCKPTNPLGAPMVSSEGACAAYYHFSGMVEQA